MPGESRLSGDAGAALRRAWAACGTTPCCGACATCACPSDGAVAPVHLCAPRPHPDRRASRGDRSDPVTRRRPAPSAGGAAAAGVGLLEEDREVLLAVFRRHHAIGRRAAARSTDDARRRHDPGGRDVNGRHGPAADEHIGGHLRPHVRKLQDDARRAIADRRDRIRDELAVADQRDARAGRPALGAHAVRAWWRTVAGRCTAATRRSRCQRCRAETRCRSRRRSGCACCAPDATPAGSGGCARAPRACRRRRGGIFDRGARDYPFGAEHAAARGSRRHRADRRSSVKGSGRFVRYATGSEVSMVTVVIRRPAFAEMPFHCATRAGLSGAGPNAPSGVSPAAHSPRERA